MELQIRWFDIKDGFRGFERLAFSFVQDKYPNSSWKKTNETRDGNKDACALIFGFQPYPDKMEQWWMEAKFSTETKVISRYRLDATIVSAILEGNVSKVIFVTNIQISTKTINDIRTALHNTLKCREILFCTRYTLEHWLSERPDQYTRFFDVPQTLENIIIKRPQLFVTQEMEFYTESVSRTVFKEPLRELFKGNTYAAYFSVFSPSDITLPLKLGKNIAGLTILSKKQIVLYAGENQVKFLFRIETDYREKKEGKVPPPTFRLGNIDILPLRPMIPLEQPLQILNIPSQKSIVDKLEESAKKMIRRQTNEYHVIEGMSGVGKSFILEQFLLVDKLAEEDIFFDKFTYSAERNNEILINIVLFLLFPYLSPNQIDEEYLKSLQNSLVTERIIELVANRNDFDKVSSLFMQLGGSEELFLSHMSINRRFILLDDLHKLNEVSARFLVLLLLDMRERRLPVFVVFAAQPQFFKSEHYQWFAERCVAIRHTCELTMRDILHCFQAGLVRDFEMLKNIMNAIEFNVIEMLIFSKYILDEERPIHSIDDLMHLCKTFRRSSILEEHVLRQFKELFSQHPECRGICDKIYWACRPFSLAFDAREHAVATHLVTSGLASYDENDCLVPKHDIYVTFYRRHFLPQTFDELGYPKESPEYLKHCFAEKFHRSLLSDCVVKVMRLVEEGKFHSVLYILQDLFEGVGKEELKKRLREEQYYSLYLSYALAANQQSLHINCTELFTRLADETFHSSNQAIQEICLRVTWELVLLCYENLEYEQSREKIKQMLLLIKKLQLCGQIQSDIKKSLHYHDAITADTLIRANMGDACADRFFEIRAEKMRKNGFIYRALSYSVRYAVTLSAIDMPRCLAILENCRCEIGEKFGVEDKHYNWCGFHISYYTMIWESRHSLIQDVLHFHKQMKKNHYSNYRHRLNAIAAYYYSIGDAGSGNRYLLKETVFEAELCRRQKAFHYGCLALREAIGGGMKSASDYLRRAGELLRPLASYHAVVSHNIKLLDNNRFCAGKIGYWFGGGMEEGVYYIDPRSAW